MSRNWLELMGFVALALFAGACADTGVGDACVPEQVPAGGFLASETYLETSSVQCATRVCLVRELDGDPLAPVIQVQHERHDGEEPEQEEERRLQHRVRLE